MKKGLHHVAEKLPGRLDKFCDRFGKSCGGADAFGLGVAVGITELALDGINDTTAVGAVGAGRIAAVKVRVIAGREVAGTRNAFQPVAMKESAEGVISP